MIFDPPLIYFWTSLWFLTKWFSTKWVMITFVTSQLGHCSLAKDCESLPNRSSTIGTTRRRRWRHDPAARTKSKNLCSSDGRVGRNYSNVEHRRYIFFCWSLFKLTSVNVFVHRAIFARKSERLNIKFEFLSDNRYWLYIHLCHQICFL